MFIKIKKQQPLLMLLFYFTTLMSLFLFSDLLFATNNAQSLGDVAATVRSSLQNVAALITAVSYVAGIGFAMMGLLKLKSHKDNPTQVPLSQPITLLIISAGLVFLPSLIKSAGATIWGSGAQLTGTSGGSHDTGATFGKGTAPAAPAAP